ncbi:hypothetical protein DAMA08_020940 (mitochondrion) [Martiniozyma asiatica (nom. inval.)]|nr:hypothetical protein DAMA08_020940 [Martiniozyma asiatica]
MKLRMNGYKNVLTILSYFDKYETKTKKYDSYLKFKEMLGYMERKDHLVPLRREHMKELCKLINKK